MAWIIVRDHLYESDPHLYQRREIGTQQEQPVPTGPAALQRVLEHTFKLYDDDGILYYTGRCDEWAIDNDLAYGGLYQAYKWGESNAGTTDLKLLDKVTHKWVSIYG